MGVGPSTKETTLHHFRDPLIKILGQDEEIDFQGIIVGGIPQDNVSKIRTGERIGAWVEAMRCDGVIVSADSWGNSDIDFANTVEQIGSRGIPVVGCSFCGTTGQFVVTNPYMDTIVDINKSEEGVETDVVGENCLTELDARKAAALLKLKMRK
ncbi:MAG: glycine/sarcosine/betaine reductase component B subunit [Lachnospiraceae bacterium]|nr:glycine/sarcosine/betaine reductase component B subunit [Lachnospiraceae bacterium]